VGIQRPAEAKRLGLAASFGQYLQRPGRGRRPFRIGAHPGDRRQHRLLSHPAKWGDAASRDRVRRSVQVLVIARRISQSDADRARLAKGAISKLDRTPGEQSIPAPSGRCGRQRQKV